MSHAPLQKLLLLTVGEQHYAISVFAIRDMLRAHPVLSIPLAPTHVAGLFNLRGKLVTALNLHARLGEEQADAALMIVIEIEQELIALMVDSVQDVISVKSEEISKPSTNRDTAHPYVTGTFRHKESPVRLLDLARLTEPS